MAAKCPICARPPTSEYRPFCSRRCADVDLQRWLVGRYAIPASREEDEEDLASASPEADQAR
jgi:endogenous inhibitor of DNA gyrase (YacG/DUF329 family)